MITNEQAKEVAEAIEQAQAGKAGVHSWLAVRGSDGAFLPLPHIAGQSGKLVWIPDGTDEENSSS